MNTSNPTEAAAALQWEQTIDLGRGLVTPGTDKTTMQEAASRCGLPLDMRGLLVIDFNGRDGLLPVACLSRGATAVVSIGTAARPTFDFVRDALGYNATQLHFTKHDPEGPPMRFQGDWVLCVGVINRSERPMEVIRHAVRTARSRVVIECALAKPEPDGITSAWRWDLSRSETGAPHWLPTSEAVLDAMKTFGCVEVRPIASTFEGIAEDPIHRVTFVGTK